MLSARAVVPASNGTKPMRMQKKSNAMNSTNATNDSRRFSMLRPPDKMCLENFGRPLTTTPSEVQLVGRKKRPPRYSYHEAGRQQRARKRGGFHILRGMPSN